jgi:hypothetical protein
MRRIIELTAPSYFMRNDPAPHDPRMGTFTRSVPVP